MLKEIYNLASNPELFNWSDFRSDEHHNRHRAGGGLLALARDPQMLPQASLQLQEK